MTQSTPGAPEGSNRQSQSIVWSKLWNLNTTLKHVQLKSLLIVKYYIPAKNITHKIMLIDSFCLRCTSAEEDIDHLFKDCMWTK